MWPHGDRAVICVGTAAFIPSPRVTRWFISPLAPHLPPLRLSPARRRAQASPGLRRSGGRSGGRARVFSPHELAEDAQVRITSVLKPFWYTKPDAGRVAQYPAAPLADISAVMYSGDGAALVGGMKAKFGADPLPFFTPVDCAGDSCRSATSLGWLRTVENAAKKDL